MSEREQVRKRAGVSRDRAAVLAGVSYPTARLYEADPDEVKDLNKRTALDRVYDGFRESAEPVKSGPERAA